MNTGNLRFSDAHDLILPDLFKALSQMDGVSKNQKNEHFKSRYANLEAVNDVVKPVLLDNNIVLTQPASVVETDDNGGVSVVVDTVFFHQSGQYAITTLSMKPDKNSPQSIGSTITYCRRYSLLSVAALSVEDDDGNSGSGRDNAPKQTQQSAPRTATKQSTVPLKQAEAVKQTNAVSAEIDRNDPAVTREAMLKLGMDINAYKIFAAAALGKPLPSDPNAYTKANSDLYDKFVKEGKHTVTIFNNDPVSYGERWKKINSEPEKKSDIRLDNNAVTSKLLELSDEIAAKSGFKSGSDLVARVKTLCNQDVPDADMLQLLIEYQADSKIIKELTAAVKAGSFTDVPSFLLSRGQ